MSNKYSVTTLDKSEDNHQMVKFYQIQCFRKNILGNIQTALTLLAVILMSFFTASCDHTPLEPVPIKNFRPVINKMSATPSVVVIGGNALISADVSDEDGDSLFYTWSTSNGTIEGEGSNVILEAPFTIGTVTVSLFARDTLGGQTKDSVLIRIVDGDPNNNVPVINNIVLDADSVKLGNELRIQVIANDPDGDSLLFSWIPGVGQIQGSGADVVWIAPSSPEMVGEQRVSVIVDDNRGGTAAKQIKLIVIPLVKAPLVQSISASPIDVPLAELSVINVEASDPQGLSITYSWELTGGAFEGSIDGPSVNWRAPAGPACCAVGPYTISVKITNEGGGSTYAKVELQVFSP